MSTTKNTVRNGRPWALTGLWIGLMAPLSIGGGLLQETSGVDPRFLPLVMVGPAIAWLICRLAVPGWFPQDTPAMERGNRWRPWVAAALASVGFMITLWAVTPDRAMITPDVPVKVLGVAAVAVGMFIGSWCEEIGYRGVMYRAMATRCGIITTIVVNGLFFGLCHLQYFSSGALVLMFFGSTILLDVFIAAAWAGSWREKVLVAAVIHAVVNAGMQLRGVDMGGFDGFFAFLAPMVVAAVIAVIAGRLLRVGDLQGRRGPVSRPVAPSEVPAPVARRIAA